MQVSEYAKMAQLEEKYWWHTGRKSIISLRLRAMHLPKASKILNVGCGTGGMIPLFQQYGQVTNVDVSDEAINYCIKKGFSNVKKIDGNSLPFEDSSFDVVAATDVLEHIEQDEVALAEWRRVLKPGGYILLTVPAYQWLWSGHDESLHHHRRYTASELHRKLNAAGLRTVKRSYIIVFSFPLIVGFRALQSIVGSSQSTSYVVLPRPVNGLFKFFLQVEARVLHFINFPFGTSVLIIGQKNEV